jgi:cytochrome c peroxidase
MKFQLESAAVLVAFLFAFPSFAGIFEPLPDVAPAPAENPTTPAKVELGRKLYFDARLSRTGKISCNSCHEVRKSGTDNRDFSLGVDGQKGGRSAPTVFNAAFSSAQFWDGRAASLEEQAKGPMINPVEMGMADHGAVVATLKGIKGYAPEFKSAFPDSADPITIDNVVRAIAAYERTLLTPSPYDRFLKGDASALSPAAQRGKKLVETVGCIACHQGVNLNGPPLPPGQGFYQKFPVFPGTEYETKYHLADDGGRFEATKKEEDRHLWRVPSWRNVAVTGPYFHNGSVKKLDEAVRVMAKVQLNKDLKDDEVSDIVAFLESLTGKPPKQTAPKLPK